MQANCEIEDQNETLIDLEQTVADAKSQTENPEHKVETENAATQTAEFEYSFKESFVQPFAEEHLTMKIGCGFILVCLVLMYSKQLLALSAPLLLEEVKV